MALDLIFSFNKHLLNPLMLKFAGAAHSPISVVRHTGRSSGRSYKTPVIVEPFGDGFIFALTYGRDVDWYRNVLAAERCTLLWHGKSYDLQAPTPAKRKVALPAFPPPLRLMLRQVLHTQYFMAMRKAS